MPETPIPGLRQICLASCQVKSITKVVATLRGSGRVTESSTVVLIPPTWGKPNYGRCDVFDERPDGRKVARRTGHCLWVGEATAVHRCSHVLARCSTSPPSNWQMALDVR